MYVKYVMSKIAKIPALVGLVNTKEDFNCKHCGKMEIMSTLLGDTIYLIILTIFRCDEINNSVRVTKKLFLNILTLMVQASPK